MGSKPQVSIIIPTASKNSHLYKQCLVSIKHQTYPPQKTQVITITNRDLKSIGKPFSFSRAVNLASKKAKGKFLLITNDDITFDPHAITSWMEAQEKNPSAILGANLKLKNSKLPAPAGYKISLWTGIVRPVYASNSLTVCDWVSGCALLVSRTAWKQLGGFDERFSPGFFEDADFCFRAKKKDIPSLLLPKIKAQHQQTISFNRNKPKKYEYWYRNKMLFLKKHASPLQLASSLLLQYFLFTPMRAITKHDGRFLPALKGLAWNLKNSNLKSNNSSLTL
jgi:GT2 family glycosyltransferase